MSITPIYQDAEERRQRALAAANKAALTQIATTNRNNAGAEVIGMPRTPVVRPAGAVGTINPNIVQDGLDQYGMYRGPGYEVMPAYNSITNADLGGSFQGAGNMSDLQRKLTVIQNAGRNRDIAFWEALRGIRANSVGQDAQYGAMSAEAGVSGPSADFSREFIRRQEALSQMGAYDTQAQGVADQADQEQVIRAEKNRRRAAAYGAWLSGQVEAAKVLQEKGDRPPRG